MSAWLIYPPSSTMCIYSSAMLKPQLALILKNLIPYITFIIATFKRVQLQHLHTKATLSERQGRKGGICGHE